jgi:FKBP-type peptidyl-prolyl cis-trans isomerase 2
MDFEGNFRFVARVDVAALRRRVETLPESAWSAAVARAAPVHRDSRGLFLKNDLKPEHLYGTVRAGEPELAAAARAVAAALKPRFPGSYLIRLQLARHMPGRGFDAHTDRYSFTLSRSHRVHLPVITNPRVWFSVGGERRRLAEGEAWEINNLRVHEGKNGGNTPRVHLIADFAAPLLSLEDRLRYFANLDAVVGGFRACGRLLARPRLAGERAPSPLKARSGRPPRAAGRVGRDVVVALAYRLRDAATGETLALDDSDEPFSFVFGRGQLPAALERPLRGLKPGEAFSAEIPAGRAYGERDARLRVRLPRKMPARFVVGGTAPFLAALKDGLLDANHPFAGRRLSFDGRVAAIRALEPDEWRWAVYEGPSLPGRRALAAAVSRFAKDPASRPVFPA